MGLSRNIRTVVALFSVFLFSACATIPVRLSDKELGEFLAVSERRVAMELKELYRGTFSCGSEIFPMLIVYENVGEEAKLDFFDPLGTPLVSLVQEARPEDVPPYRCRVYRKTGESAGAFGDALEVLGSSLPLQSVFAGVVPHYRRGVDVYRYGGGFLVEGENVRAKLDARFRVLREEIETEDLSLELLYRYGKVESGVPKRIEISSRGCKIELSLEKGGLRE